MTALLSLLLAPLAPQAHQHAPPAAPAACSAEHAAMGHCQLAPAPPPAPAPAAPPTCTPEHAAMGHCQLAPAPPPAPAPAAPPTCTPEHAAMGHCAAPEAASGPAEDDCPPEHARMGHCTTRAVPAAPTASGTALPAGDAPAPAVPTADYADRIWGRSAMATPREAMRREHGGMAFSQVIFNIAELQVRDGADGYRWDGEGWFGGDIHRVAVKTEGSGSFGERLDHGEVQLLYSRAVGPYFNLQAGARQDIGRGASATHAVIGVEGLAPYWFDVEATLFLSTRGDLTGRIEGYYDQRITQRLIAQPRVELNLAAQDVASTGTAAGISDLETGVRLRYEIAREFAPYLGLSWEREFGRAGGRSADDRNGLSVLIGVRTWF